MSNKRGISWTTLNNDEKIRNKIQQRYENVDTNIIGVEHVMERYRNGYDNGKILIL